MCSIESPLSSSGLQSMSNVFLPVWKDCYVGQRSTFFSRLIVMGSTLHCTHEQRSLQISLSLTLILGLQACHCNSLPIRHEACIQHHHDVGWKIQHFPAPVMPRLQQKHTSLNQICRAMPQHLSCASSPHIQRKHNKNTQGKHTKKHAMILVDAHRAKDKGELTTWFFFFVRVLVFVLVEFEFMLEIQTGLHQLHFFFFVEFQVAQLSNRSTLESRLCKESCQSCQKTWTEILQHVRSTQQVTSFTSINLVLHSSVGVLHKVLLGVLSAIFLLWS